MTRPSSQYEPRPLHKWLMRHLLPHQTYMEWLWSYARRDRRTR